MASILSLKVKWRSFGPTKKYNIYYRRDDEANYIKANSLPLSDNVNGNVYDIPNQVAPNTYYWVYVVQNLNNNDAPETFIGQNTVFSFPILNKVKIKTQSDQ
jgi:hypothetical protein